MNSAGVSQAGFLCPTCRVNLVMSERQGIEIDYCPQCRGVWLDRGELDKIIERSLETAPSQERAQPAPVQQQVSQSHRSDHGPSGYGSHHGHGDRHRSFLGRLFD